jgi:hypothetical protein
LPETNSDDEHQAIPKNTNYIKLIQSFESLTSFEASKMCMEAFFKDLQDKEA